ncbi:DNA mismatch repair endonuclease MutL [Caloranaerobacter azorensis]|uniref:DNA mismatch repair protein MutL n=1 Tax=Caloranaerobacter azorensis TaxID=116090 RepID=A0A6P1YBN0_9FIRM|nr:DNA mismatch repair endonuclease MutL [Caloranaerobacter azorensis]QIB26123.1 DNA mismatch repair endonuclease MutL [Caloranaerobacter azorensis]
MSRIKILDESTINKIAAGEIIERPASVVKELVENSIDAGATSITIEIKGYGKDYIRVTDNGVGIESDDLEIAFMRHTTSKISKIEDLEKIKSLGFRGEALASISVVSQLKVITKTDNNLIGNQIVLHGGRVISREEVGCPKGTTVIVTNLFYNTPVRAKFLKSESKETLKINDTIYKLALSNPNISFKYIKDNKVIFRTRGNGNDEDVIYNLFGRNFLSSLIRINYKDNNFLMKGFISEPSFTRGNRSHQYFFVNNRYIKSNLLSKTIESAYGTLLPSNRFPVIILYLFVPPYEIDVNIHPTKTEVRFKNEKEICSTIYDTVKKLLKKEDIIPQMNITNKDNVQETQINFIDNLSTKSNYNKEVSNFLVGKNSKINYEKPIDNKIKKDFNISSNDEVLKNRQVITNTLIKENKEKLIEKENKQKFSIDNIQIIGTLFSTYILAEDKLNAILYIIDQHAAHERIMFEKLKRQLKNQIIISQQMLVPEIINLTFNEYKKVELNLEIFNKLGFTIEPFGKYSIVLRSVPVIFNKPNAKQLFLDILDNLENSDSKLESNYDLRLEKIMKLACTSSIKAGDKIDELEISSLIKELFKTENPYTCPHGRPTIIKLTQSELEKKFKRT